MPPLLSTGQTVSTIAKCYLGVVIYYFKLANVCLAYLK